MSEAGDVERMGRLRAVFRETRLARVPGQLRQKVADAYQKVTESPARRPTDTAHVRVRQVMSRPALVLPEDATLGQAWDLMQERRCRHLVVVDLAGRATGLLTQNQITAPAMASREPWRARLVHAHMSADAVALSPDDDLATAAEVLTRLPNGGAPVLAADLRPVGFITPRDLLKVLVGRAPVTLWV